MVVRSTSEINVSAISQLGIVVRYVDKVARNYWNIRGEGISHVNFTVDNVAEVSRIMNEEGFATLQARWVEDSPYAYYDTDGPLKMVWESFQASAGTRPISFRYPEK